MTAHDQYASVRYLVDDVQAAIDFYTTHLGFVPNTTFTPAFADVAYSNGPINGTKNGWLISPGFQKACPIRWAPPGTGSG